MYLFDVKEIRDVSGSPNPNLFIDLRHTLGWCLDFICIYLKASWPKRCSLDHRMCLQHVYTESLIITDILRHCRYKKRALKFVEVKVCDQKKTFFEDYKRFKSIFTCFNLFCCQVPVCKEVTEVNWSFCLLVFLLWQRESCTNIYWTLF